MDFFLKTKTSRIAPIDRENLFDSVFEAKNWKESGTSVEGSKLFLL
jgi:hypothetical protein